MIVRISLVAQGTRKQNKVKRLILYKNLIILFIVGSIAMSLPLDAEDGRLLDSYPPNVSAENFTLPDMKGEQHQLKEFRGKYVLVNFWAMSCNVCKSEMTTLQSAYELLGDEKLAIISIHAGENFDGVDEVLELNKVTYTVLFDTDLRLGAWGIPILPTTFIVSPKGDIRYRAVGTRVWNSPFMIDFIQSILDSDGSRASSSQTL